VSHWSASVSSPLLPVPAASINSLPRDKTVERARNTPDSTVDHRAIAHVVHLRERERKREREKGRKKERERERDIEFDLARIRFQITIPLDVGGNAIPPPAPLRDLAVAVTACLRQN